MPDTQTTCNIGLASFGHGDQFTASAVPFFQTNLSEGNATIHLSTELTEGQTDEISGRLSPPGPDYCFTPASIANQYGTLDIFSDGRFTLTPNNDALIPPGSAVTSGLSIPIGQFMDEESGSLNQQLLNLQITIHSSAPSPEVPDDNDSAELLVLESGFHQTLLPQLEQPDFIV